jgi:hypothetical protein
MERGIVRQTHGTIDVRSPKLVAHLFVAIHDLQTTDVLQWRNYRWHCRGRVMIGGCAASMVCTLAARLATRL